MHLKRLDVFGFKSFADRLALDLVPGVSAIVGPNGSGKSNIADAVRWVLGEQSAKSLRGAKMEDVIFAGSATRKSLNLAEVSLTLDNTDGYLSIDYAEVTVTRRVYRSGDSEYLLNQQPCRLKDIAELFMDSGLGKEAFSIIGQGRIEEILSTRSEDRRGIFEEAAGIVKFKTRRKEAEKKLADAGLNIVRIEDILAELGDQLVPLQGHAEMEALYRETHSTFAQLQIGVLVAEIAALINRRQECDQTRQVLQTKRADVLRREQAADSHVATLRQQADALDQELQFTQERLVAATAQVEKCEGDRRVAFERQEHAITLLDDLRLSGERLHAEQEALERERLKLQVDSASAEKQVTQLRTVLEAEIESTEGQSTIAALREHVSEARSELIEAMRRQAAEHNEVKNTEVRQEQLRRRIERLDNDLASVCADLKTAEKQFEECVVAAACAQEEGTRYRQMLRESTATLSAREQELMTLTTAWQKVDRVRLEAQSRMSTLQDLQQELDGYASGPKAILLAGRQERTTGVRGSVAQLLNVRPEYELAIETALGASAQNIIVDSEADARKAIEWLKKRQLGRATFLPLQTIRGRRLAPHDLQMVKSGSGYIGLAADLVKVDSAFRAVVDWLLGNVIVADALAEANTIARVLQHRVRVVTLAGDVVNTGGSMTGGSVAKRGTGLLGRSHEIEVLAQKQAELSEELQAMSRQRDVCAAEMKDVKERQAVVQRDLAACDDRLRLHQTQQARLESGAASLRDKAATWTRERDGLAEEERNSHACLQSLQAGMAEVAAAVQAAEGCIVEWEGQLAEAESALTGRNDRLTELRVQVAEREEALRGVQVALQRLMEHADGFRQEEDRIAGEQAHTIERLNHLRGDLSVAQEHGKTAERLRDSLQSELTDMRRLREERIHALEQGEADRGLVRQEGAGIDADVHGLELAYGRADAELETKLELLREEHGLGVELATEKYGLRESLTIARAKLSEAKSRLDSFGEVHLGAIEEYQRLQERHAFLLAEQQDLETARTQLTMLIAEIDHEMARRFVETFAKVREQFGMVFASLFGGGRADVYLVDDTQPLTCGIEIAAEPPGKKMQHLSLLSGGERALTALALLFAILRVRPVPFCVLDEVEAALDEANVSRFASYLREFSQASQFIVITHRRGTMEAADALYGVTMQESGVSKLVSVRVLEEEAESA